MALAETRQNVAEAARISGMSRQTIYKGRRLLNSKQITRLN
ncbi:helix-turn-helix domain-containing protein [Nitrosomonas aestuarii]